MNIGKRNEAPERLRRRGWKIRKEGTKQREEGQEERNWQIHKLEITAIGGIHQYKQSAILERKEEIVQLRGRGGCAAYYSIIKAIRGSSSGIAWSKEISWSWSIDREDRTTAWARRREGIRNNWFRRGRSLG